MAAAALQAQAVAVRTYALTAHAGGAKFDVYSDTRSQVYRGPAAETASTERRGRSRRPGRSSPTTATGDHLLLRLERRSHRSRAGRLPRSLAEPWLVGVADPYDQGPGHSWTGSLELRRGR